MPLLQVLVSISVLALLVLVVSPVWNVYSALFAAQSARRFLGETVPSIQYCSEKTVAQARTYRLFATPTDALDNVLGGITPTDATALRVTYADGTEAVLAYSGTELRYYPTATADVSYVWAAGIIEMTFDVTTTPGVLRVSLASSNFRTSFYVETF